MKKKFLSLMMAAAVVATTSVSAFAKDITGDEVDAAGNIKGYETEVTVTGDIQDEKGLTKPGTINVSVPTTAAFTVTKDGVFTSGELDVVNNGTQTIEVFANEFIDVNKNEGVKLVKKTELATNSRAAVNMKLQGNRDIAYLGPKTSTSGTTGIFDDAEFNGEQLNGKKISELQVGDKDRIILSGEAGTNKALKVDTAVKDKFTLKLMIRKKPLTNNANDASDTTHGSELNQDRESR